MTHLKYKHIVVELAPGGNPDILKCDLIHLALEHHCDVHAERDGVKFYEICYDKLMEDGVPQ